MTKVYHKVSSTLVAVNHATMPSNGIATTASCQPKVRTTARIRGATFVISNASGHRGGSRVCENYVLWQMATLSSLLGEADEGVCNG